jgi:hypothetical protein
MLENIFNIGEHIVSIRSRSHPLMSWVKTYYRILDSNFPHKSPDLSIHIEEGYGVPFVDYQVQISPDSNKITYRRADYLIEVDQHYTTARILVYNDFALKHAMTNLYSAFIVHHGWGLLIHSSCVDHQRKAFLFAGQSGAGKSTVAKLSSPRSILSDEATLIKILENDIWVFDSPFRSELTMPYDYHSCQLAGIHLLIQSTENKTNTVSKSEALVKIMDKVFFWHHDHRETAKVLSMCRQLVDHIPVYNLYFQKNDTFWEMIS